jgi:hypothetical protein
MGPKLDTEPQAKQATGEVTSILCKLDSILAVVLVVSNELFYSFIAVCNRKSLMRNLPIPTGMSTATT